MRTLFLAALLAVVAGGPALAAGGHQHHHGGGHAQAGPYAGLQHREIKALSEDDLAGLRAGEGMGMALPAELNGYPGPRHVLEHADALALTDAQRSAVQAAFASMQAKAQALGHKVIAAEAALDRLFADKAATAASLDAATAEVGRLRGELRATHLRYHLDMRALLTTDQIAHYEMLRGYKGH